MRKIPARYYGIVFPFTISIFMSGIVSAVATLRAVGFHLEMVKLWLGTWPIAWVVAFPALLMVLPLVRRLLTYIIETPARH